MQRTFEESHSTLQQNTIEQSDNLMKYIDDKFQENNNMIQGQNQMIQGQNQMIQGLTQLLVRNEENMAQLLHHQNKELKQLPGLPDRVCPA